MFIPSIHADSATHCPLALDLKNDLISVSLQSIFSVYFYNTVREINQKVTSHIQCLDIYQVDRVFDHEKGLFLKIKDMLLI